VKRRLQQLIGWYLTLCFALAGAIGTNPILHRLVEHGNQGPSHIHAGASGIFIPTAARHSHASQHSHSIDDGHSHPRSHAHDHSSAHPPHEHSHPERSVAHHHGFAFSNPLLSRFWRALLETVLAPSRRPGGVRAFDRVAPLPVPLLHSEWKRGGPTRSTNSSSSSPEVPEHHHDSLAQTVANGLLEVLLESPVLATLHLAIAYVSGGEPNPIKIAFWDPQTASRAPPFWQG